MMTMTTELREVFRSIGFDEEWEKKVREEGEKAGRDEGRKEGEKAGRDEALQKTARSMLADGMTPARVAKFVALPVAEIEALRRPN
jgi:predicted transposase YdaD